MRTTKSIIALAAITIALLGSAAPSEAATSSRTAVSAAATSRPVVIYGDSIVWQARQNLVYAFAQKTSRPVTVRAFGGTALCDWTSRIREDLAAKTRPAAIVLSFTGNTATPCTGAGEGRTAPAPGTAGFYDHNRRAMDAIRSAAAKVGVPVVWISPPPLGNTTSNHVAVFGQMAARRGFTVVEAGDSVTSTPGQFVSTMRCLSDEGASRGCTAGRIRVRADDKVHFYVARTGYSSGGRRWSDAAAAGVVKRIGR
jgi:hypothetical protein